ncbi:hypothetical protein DLC15_05175 [Salmonella enterica subsp. enterica serovar Telelkebir]|nr:hypothetical protein [Salmonella enterica subsp. enterica serovar Telelkebir]ECC3295647.1 hypothetical protein [Salmonella enterica subsp. enterica]EDR2888302.1 hypothetical protein [Salmonella enterica subsp. enterica]EDR6140823.1 hypothetical protein [Salmonella enterica subsp. enterica]EDU9860145.1 hypothetical protein [Salmonella enterica subsp. enterica]
MSGTQKKAADKQTTKSRAGKASSQEVAATAGTVGAGSESPVTLPGHYAAVGAVPVAVTLPDAVTPAGELTAAPGIAAACAALRAGDSEGEPEVLGVRAIPAGGFWRCGLFWSATPWTVVVCDDLDGQTTPEGVLCVSRDIAARLKAEPLLVVTTLETVTEPA